MEIEGDLGASVDFLVWLRPEGPWTLTAIPPEGGRTKTESFTSGEIERLKSWVSNLCGKQNIYFMVNSSRTYLNSKAKKEDVEAVEFLHVDIDPRKGYDIETERASALERLENFNPPPSAIIDSGGGYQGFWRLDESLYVGGDLTQANEAESYNQQLEILLGGDACHNVDRIMRLPGTVNIPNEKKRKAGRVPALSKIVYTKPREVRTYHLSEFTPAPQVQSGDGASSPNKVKISGNLPRLTDLDDLPEAVSPRTRMLIVQGDDPDDQTRYSSRSEVTFAVCCELIRAGCDDDTIAAVLLDPDFAISGHTLSQKRSVDYAARQIERAREEVIEPWLRKLNAKHAVISDVGGRCRVISEVLDQNLAQPRTRISKKSFEDFRNSYMHQKVQVGTTKDGQAMYAPVGKWWLENPMRRQFETMVFAPRREVNDAYNLWQGFACEAIPGQGHELFLNHLRDNVCSGSEEYYQYLINWMARAVQNPGEPGQVAVILRGGRGAGKGTTAQAFGSLWGRHFLHISSAKHLVGQFNAHLRDCVFLFADEAFFAGDKQHESVLKTLVTEDTIMVEGKGVDAEVSPNFTHLMMASNDHWVVPAGADERRYFILDVGESAKQNSDYFRRIRSSLDGGGRESLLHHLMTIDLSDFEVRDVPQTDALREQKLLSLNAEEQWWLERLMDGRVTRGAKDWHREVQKDRLQKDYLEYTETQKFMRRASPTLLGRFLSRQMAKVPDQPNRGWPNSVQKMTDVEKWDEEGRTYTNRERVYYYELPSLEACRKAWDEKYGGPFDWPVDTTDPEPELVQGELDNEEPY